MKGQTVLTSATISDQNIKIAGDNAIVRHRFVAETNKYNIPGHIDIIILMVWKKSDVHWKLLARQAAQIPEKNP